MNKKTDHIANTGEERSQEGMASSSLLSSNEGVNEEDASIVDVRDLCIRFGDFFAVKNVTFSVRRGEIFGFLGANGAGKTTTIRVICGLLNATSGTVIVDGEVFSPGREDVIKSKVGYMSQKFTLYNDLTVGENLAFAAALHRVPTDLFEARKRDLFEMIQFDWSERTLVADLPGGTKQHVALVAALIHDPSLVVLDEPTAGVSPFARMRFWQLIRRLTQRGKTVFVTTHYMDEAENCDRVVLMRSGEIIALGTPEGLKGQTFHQQMYSLTPRAALTVDQVYALKGACQLFEPYGRSYHVIFKEATLPEDLMHLFDPVPIQPSLEDVFIQQVEGDR